MTTEEFSNEFDTLINSFSQSEAFGHSQNPLNFDEYEKSVHLTKAQEEVVRELYTGQLTDFEETEQIRRFLSNLVKTAEISCREYPGGVSSKSVMAPLPEDLMYIVYESAILNGATDCLKEKEVQVIPVLHDEYHRIKNNPFRKANDRKVLRFDVDGNKVELLSEHQVTSYLVRYISRPKPIILTDLPVELSINNYNNKTECELSPDIHRTILDVAV